MRHHEPPVRDLEPQIRHLAVHCRKHCSFLAGLLVFDSDVGDLHVIDRPHLRRRGSGDLGIQPHGVRLPVHSGQEMGARRRHQGMEPFSAKSVLRRLLILGGRTGIALRRCFDQQIPLDRPVIGFTTSKRRQSPPQGGGNKTSFSFLTDTRPSAWSSSVIRLE